MFSLWYWHYLIEMYEKLKKRTIIILWSDELLYSSRRCQYSIATVGTSSLYILQYQSCISAIYIQTLIKSNKLHAVYTFLFAQWQLLMETIILIVLLRTTFFVSLFPCFAKDHD